ncbi:cytochrome P450 [Rhizoctonia solani]|nr:cytochrome P450 [Rhizoctonia solani]
MKAAYGYDVTSPNDSYVAKIKQVDENLTKSFLPTHFLVNIFPFLVHVPSWLPGAGWKKTAKEWRELEDGVIEDTFQWTKTQMENGVSEPSIVNSFMEDIASRGEASPEEVDIIKHVGMSPFGTTTLEVFVLAMLLFPDVQRKTQEEIDQVIGSHRLPEIEDLGSLPYLGNLVQEVLRGYFIPKGAVVIGNAWAMSRGETTYVQPEEFNPDRFSDPSVPPAPAFGWGRRIASLLATFDFTMAKDEEGNDIVPSAGVRLELA